MHMTIFNNNNIEGHKNENHVLCLFGHVRWLLTVRPLMTEKTYRMHDGISSFKFFDLLGCLFTLATIVTHGGEVDQNRTIILTINVASLTTIVISQV